MDIVILDSAYKHGVSEESITHCLKHSVNDIILSHPPPKRMVFGFDKNGNPLEVAVVDEEERDRRVVIHAMRLRKKYYRLLREGSDL